MNTYINKSFVKYSLKFKTQYVHKLKLKVVKI